MKSKKETILYSVIVLFLGCTPQYIPCDESQYQVVPVEQHRTGFFVESEPGSLPVKYLSDNEVYLPCRSILYKIYISENNESRLMEFEKTNNPMASDSWNLISNRSESKDSNMVTHYLLITTASETSKNVPDDYNQTTVTYYHLNNEKKIILTENTGVRENYRNIWLHPSRMGIYKIFFTAGWPFIDFLSTQQSQYDWCWNWSGSYVGDPKIFSWDGIEEFYCTYKEGNRIIGDFGFSMVECRTFDVTSYLKNRISKGRFFFNPDMEILSMDYTSYRGDLSLKIEAIDFFDDCSRIDSLKENWYTW